MRMPLNDTEATTAPLRLQMEQSQRLGSTMPCGGSSSNSTAPQWHVARCLRRIRTPATSVITVAIPQSPESAVAALTHVPETVLGHLANEISRQRLVVGNLNSVLGRLVRFQFLAKRLEHRRCWRKVEVCLVCRESEQETRLHEKGRSPLDRL